MYVCVYLPPSICMGSASPLSTRGEWCPADDRHWRVWWTTPTSSSCFLRLRPSGVLVGVVLSVSSRTR